LQLTDQGRQKIDELARRYAVSADAVITLLQAVVNGHGSMAQFSHPELGGSGQWMRGGMTMVGDMFNSGLKMKVEGLCSELSQLLAQQPFVPAPASVQSQSQGETSLFVPEPPGRAAGQWWPAELGSANGAGAQNQIRYAYFNAPRRLAVDLNGHVTVYDTLDHQIGGVSQQQGGGSSLTLTSQYGTVSVSSLPIVSVDGAPAAPPPRPTPAAAAPPPASPSSSAPPPSGPPPLSPPAAETAQEPDIFAKIERLADLHHKGILSEQEFAAKKAELLARL
jgi:putative oligomerization/nucleic acid binding protein